MLYIFPFILWFFYLELHPGLTNIWIRSNHEGNKVFCPSNIFHLLVYPFKNSRMWIAKFWDINLFTFYGVCILFYVFCNNLFSLFEKRDERWTKLYLKMQHL